MELGAAHLEGRAAPVGIAAEQAAGRFGRLIVERGAHTVDIDVQRMGQVVT